MTKRPSHGALRPTTTLTTGVGPSVSHTPVTTHEVDAALARLKAAEAAMAAVLRTPCPCRVAAEEQIAAFAEWQRLRALATPLRDWLLAQEFDGRVIHTSPATPRRLAKRAHRDPAEVKAVLDELVTEGLIRKVGNGYDSLAMADGGDG